MRVCDLHRTKRAGGFTMVEIALSIAVVAFALVAILGVLPTGMSVQKDNRDDNIINQEGRYWLEAIRSGAQGLDDITNYVESITITNLTRPTKTFVLDNTPNNLLRPVDIIALLSTPKYFGGGDTNRVLARVKSITGPASEKGPLTNEFSFRYELQVELTPSIPLPPAYVVSATDSAGLMRYNDAVAENLHDVRLILRWPVVQRGNGWFVGNNRKTFRARIAGKYEPEKNVSTRVASAFQKSFAELPSIIVPNRFNVQTNQP